MGQVFDKLTNPGTALQDPNTGQTMAVGSPQQVLNSADASLRQAFQPNMSAILSGQPQTGTPSIGKTPNIGRPSFQEAAESGAMPGSGNAMSPGLSKAGKLAVLLTQGLQGALAGHAAQEQAILESGGHRAGGAGLAFQSAYMLPWQRAMAPLQYQQEQAKTTLAQAGAQPVQTPYGPMPAEFASRSLLPWMVRAGAMENVAQTGKEGRIGAAQIGAQGGIQREQIGQRFKTSPNGLVDTWANNGQGAIIPGTQNAVQVTPDIAAQYGMPQEFIGRLMKLSDLSSLERAQSYQNVVTQGANGPALVNRNPASPNFGQARNLGIGAPAMSGIVPVAADPNNPGNITYAPKTAAVRQGMSAPSSAPTQAAKSTLKSATSGKIGDEINAFNTAIQHAELLRSAAAALQNGDQNTLNSLKNSFKNEFGSTGPVTAEVIADAYTREVNKMLSSGHITDSEIGAIGKTLNVNRQSLPQTLNVLNAYEALAKSKMQMRQNQVNQGMKGKANFPSNQNDPLGIR